MNPSEGRNLSRPDTMLAVQGAHKLYDALAQGGGGSGSLLLLNCNPQQLVRAGGCPGAASCMCMWDVAGLIPLFPAQMGIAEQI